MGPAVSIVVPCFNSERFVEHAIDSALSQDGDLEVIVVDDGSTDRSGAIVQAIAARDRRVRLCSEPNRGASHARNVGFRATTPTRRFVLFLDADDVLAPGAIRILQDRLERESDLAAAFGSRSRIDERGTVVERAPSASPVYYADDHGVRRLDGIDRVGYWHVMPVNPITTPGQCLIRVSALSPCGVFDQRYSGCEDWEMWLRLARRSAIGVEHHEVLRYRDHDANSSKRYGLMYAERARVYRAQLEVVTSEEALRFRAAWRFGMFTFDAHLCVGWARERLAARDLLGSGRFLFRSIRYEAQHLWAAVRDEPDLDAMLGDWTGEDPDTAIDR